MLSESQFASRTYILNRPKKLNAPILDHLKRYAKVSATSERNIFFFAERLRHSLLFTVLQEWNKAELCKMIIARGAGRAFCAGGDVAGSVEP